MNLSPDLAERAYHWISTSPNDGQALQCRKMNKLWEHHGPCNCERDALLADLAECARPPDVLTNGAHA